MLAHMHMHTSYEKKQKEAVSLHTDVQNFNVTYETLELVHILIIYVAIIHFQEYILNTHTLHEATL